MPDTFPPAVVELRDELDRREVGRWVTEMYARHRGTWTRAT